MTEPVRAVAKAEPLPPMPKLAWDPARAKGWVHARIYERRRLLPDALIDEVPADGGFALSPLAPGRHDLLLVLTRPQVAKGGAERSWLPLGGDDAIETTPPGPLRVGVPGAP